LVRDPASPGGQGLGRTAVKSYPVQLPARPEKERRRVRRPPRDGELPSAAATHSALSGGSVTPNAATA
jgi:hypothetical protein